MKPSSTIHPLPHYHSLGKLIFSTDSTYTLLAVCLLTEAGPMSTTDLAKLLGMVPENLNWKMASMERAGLFEKLRTGERNGKAYFIAPAVRAWVEVVTADPRESAEFRGAMEEYHRLKAAGELLYVHQPLQV